jgi:hypothetical protein
MAARARSLVTRTLVLLPALLALLGASAFASIPTPDNGTPIVFKLGLTFDIKLTNANGCNFDYEFSVSDPDILEIGNGSGTGVKKATIGLTGLKAGKTTVFGQSMNGTCPGAIFSWPVTVEPNVDLMLDQFGDYTKDSLADVKLDFKVGLKTYSDALKGLSAEYKAGNLTDTQLHDSYHDSADTLRKGLHWSGVMAYEWVVGGGSDLLAAHGLSFGDAPPEMFAGGCGDFDKFQDGVCSLSSKFHDSFDKASKKGAMAFEKAGAPRMGQWNILPPLYAGGPVYPSQVGSLLLPQPLLGPLTITTLPVTAAAEDSGRLRVSGMGATARSGDLEVSLTRTVDGDPPVSTTLTPDIVLDEWTVTFPNLLEGTYVLDMRYADDTYGTTIPIHIYAQF